MRNFSHRIKNFNKQMFFRTIAIMFMDLILIAFSYTLALWVRYDFSFADMDPEFLHRLPVFILITAAISIVIFYCMRLYHSVWSFAGVSEAIRISMAYIIMLPFILFEVLLFRLRLPISVHMMGYVLSYLLTMISRFAYRVFLSIRGNVDESAPAQKENIMIIGGGSAGMQLIREFKYSKHLNANVCCVIDDNAAKLHKVLSGVPIVGDRTMIPEMAEKYDIQRIILAIPTISPAERRDILNICQNLNCKIQTLPGVYQLVNGEVSVAKLRQVELTDLLGREEIKVNNKEILDSAVGRTILVTGGGGSIGSELCRQIAASYPKKLVIFDMYENNAFAIQQELRAAYPDLDLEVIIGSVRDKARVKDLFASCHPAVIYHAAAHKHVPLMEDSPNEAIKNNVAGTWNVAECAAECGAEKMILISTDKAVNPTNVMGASKRICEMIIQMMARRNTGTKFVAVRFGNVLGSNGSVVPLFEKQIAKGGPVTVTDKNIIRYFMTIQEAVSLVLQAGYYAKGGEIFVLDMGEPVKIDDMARTLIRLSGYVPDVDIKIEYVGLRPGEKLYEELLMDEEGLEKTSHSRIFIGKPIEMDDEKFRKQLEKITEDSMENPADIREEIAEIVPTYHEPVVTE